MKQVIIRKVSDSETAENQSPIVDGDTYNGIFYKEPTVGECFVISRSGGKYFKTSTVREILSENTFRTKNSIYQWEFI